MNECMNKNEWGACYFFNNIDLDKIISVQMVYLFFFLFFTVPDKYLCVGDTVVICSPIHRGKPLSCSNMTNLIRLPENWLGERNEQVISYQRWS